MAATRSHTIFQRAFSSLCAHIRQCCLQKLSFDSTCLIFSTPLKHFSEHFLSSGEKARTNYCKCFPHFQSFALRWESRIRNISHTHHTGIHCFGACLTNLSPPDFSEADLAVLSCTPGREEAHLWIAYIYVKHSHPIKWELCDRYMERCQKL